MPPEAKRVAFYALGPLAATGVLLLIPYIRSRIAIVTPRTTSNFVLGAAVGLSVLQLPTWALMYYQVEVFGTSTIGNIALFLKDLILVSSIVVFALLTVRLVRWYAKTRNRVVLLFGGFAAGNIAFSIFHLLPDFVSKPVPRFYTQVIGIAFQFLLWSGLSALLLLNLAYYRGTRRRYIIPVLLHMVGATIAIMSGILFITLDPNLRTVAVVGLAAAGPVWLWSYLRLVPAQLNPTAKEYYRGVGYGMGLLAASTCGMGLAIPPVFPLSGFPSLSIHLPSAALAFAVFTSCASYFSIQEDVRRQIRKAEAFVASMGEAEAIMSNERQVTEFYERFTRMAKDSGAVEEGAITKDEIFQYANALKKIQRITT